MQKIYGISVENGEKLKTLLRVEIEGKLTKKLFFGPKNIFLFFFGDVESSKPNFLSFLVFHQKRIFFLIEIRYCFHKKILSSIKSTKK